MFRVENGQLLDRYRIGPILGVSYRIVSASVVPGKHILRAPLQIGLITGRVTQDDQKTFAPPYPTIRLEGREAEGDCNLTPASP